MKREINKAFHISAQLFFGAKGLINLAKSYISLFYVSSRQDETRQYSIASFTCKLCVNGKRNEFGLLGLLELCL